jgi:RND superfamily putative drug exporter
MSESRTTSESRITEVGKFARFPAGRRSKWAVLVFWLIVAALVAGPAGKLMGAQKNDAVSWLPGNAESTQVIRASAQFQAKDELPAIVVYERGTGVTPQDMASVNAQIAKFNALGPVDRASVGSIPSQDKKALQVLVPINAGSAGWNQLAAAVDNMRSIAKTSPAGLSVHFTGPGGVAADSSAAFSGIDGKLLYSALAVVIFILLLTYRSPVLWLLPVVSAGLALTVAQAVVYALAAKANLTVNAQSAGILTCSSSGQAPTTLSC